MMSSDDDIILVRGKTVQKLLDTLDFLCSRLSEEVEAADKRLQETKQYRLHILCPLNVGDSDRCAVDYVAQSGKPYWRHSEQCPLYVGKFVVFNLIHDLRVAQDASTSLFAVAE